MKLRTLQLLFLAAALRPASGAGAITNAAGAPAPAAAADEEYYPAAPALPGKGMAQHDFLFAGQDDTRRPVIRMYLVRGGQVVWTYEMQRVDSNGVASAFSDIHRLTNGDIVFAYQAGWRKIDRDGKTIYDYRCPCLGSNAWTECHSAQPIGQDKVLFAVNGLPGKLYLYNIKTGQMEMEHDLESRNTKNSVYIHAQFRNIRMTKAGTYLVPQ